MLIGIGVAPTPEVAELVLTHHARVAEAMRPFTTGATYVNFLNLEGASPERVGAAYFPEDWERLVALKDRFDPENVLRFGHNKPP
jgi:FAD/FMN-containing dehydrogenase